MLIRAHKIPADGEDVAFAIPVEAIRASIAKDDDLTEVFKKPIDCEIHLELSKDDVFLSGRADTALHPVCDRCGEPFDYPLHLDLAVTCCLESPEISRKLGSDIYQESEEGVVYYRNDEVDLGEIIREQLLLSLPMKFLCRESCKGLCTHCGANLNEGLHLCRSTPTLQRS